MSRLLFLLNTYRNALVALALSLYGLYLRVDYFAKRDLWLDELHQYKSLVGPLKPFWQRLDFAEMTSFPGDYVLMYPFAQWFGQNKWGLVIPHAISTVIGFYLLYLICSRHMKTPFGFLIAFSIVALNSNLIFHSFELRPYAVLQTLSLAAFYFSEDIVGRLSTLTRRRKWLIGAVFVFTTFYHAYGLPIIFFCMAYCVLSRLKGNSLKNVLASILPFLGPFLGIAIPIFLWYSLGSEIIAKEQWRNIHTFDYIPNPITDLNRFLRTVFGNLMGFKKLKFLVNGIILAVLIPQPERWKQLGFFLVLVILPIQLMCLSDVLKQYWFLQRQFVWVMPLYAFLIGWCWDSVFVFCRDRLAPKLMKRRA